jgi:hypothetical protein
MHSSSRFALFHMVASDSLVQAEAAPAKTASLLGDHIAKKLRNLLKKRV